jgi:ABC-type multidrug transport system fused ATPase/permease subunit
MTLWQIIRRLVPYVRSYHVQVAGTLLLTLLGALTAQVNPFALRHAVNRVPQLLDQDRGVAGWAGAARRHQRRAAGKEVVEQHLSRRACRSVRLGAPLRVAPVRAGGQLGGYIHRRQAGGKSWPGDEQPGALSAMLGLKH